MVMMMMYGDDDDDNDDCKCGATSGLGRTCLKQPTSRYNSGSYIQIQSPPQSICCLTSHRGLSQEVVEGQGPDQVPEATLDFDTQT